VTLWQFCSDSPFIALFALLLVLMFLESVVSNVCGLFKKGGAK
jgi:hypothetical protein